VWLALLAAHGTRELTDALRGTALVDDDVSTKSERERERGREKRKTGKRKKE